MDRRLFCLSSAAAAVSAWAASVAIPAAPAASAAGIRLHRFFYDRRYSAGRAFGMAAEHTLSSAAIVGICGDITAIWRHDLCAQWSGGGGAIAGLTTARTLFCLEQLAKDHWMRVLVRAEHAISDGHEMAHRLTASKPMFARMKPVLAAEDWPTKMPAVLATCPRADGAPRMTCVVGSGDGRSAMTDETLVSFVIA